MSSPHKPEKMTDTLFDVNLDDEKPAAGKTKGKGYHDWEAGAPHDRNHDASFECMPNISHWRQRITAPLWRMVVLYSCLAILVVVIIVLAAVLTARLHGAASKMELGISGSFNASESVVLTVTV